MRWLPFVILSRSRWERIRMALDAWPRLVDHLNDELRRRPPPSQPHP